ncbi:MAG: CARDB domain-containing protein, partial [Candidatus Bathyarchaeia archaeon]
MEKILSLIMIGLLLSSLFFVFTPQVNGQEAIIFQDDFESYAVGSFPSAGGWQIIWSGAGSQYQVITDSYYASPTKSLQLMGYPGYSVVVKRDFSTNAGLIGYEALMMSTNIEGGGGISFFNRPIATWGRYYASVSFLNGYIGSGSVQLKPFTPYTWYKIRVILDKITREYDVWIDDVLVGKDLVEPNDPNEILSLHIGVSWHRIAHYFDDIKVFSVSSNFEASITPTERTTSLGGTASYVITIRNYQETSSDVTLSVTSLTPSWFSLEREHVYLAPGEVANVRLNLVVPEDPSAVGVHPFSIIVSDGLIQKILAANLTVVINPIMSNLEPKNDTTIGSTDVVISWRTSSSASSEVYIKRIDELEFIRWNGGYGVEHVVHIYNLSRNTDYIWYVHSSTLYGNVTSEIRVLHVANGLSFTQDVYAFNVERDYAQKASISVINTDTQAHDLLLQITNPYNDLIVGFVGAGSVDQIVSVSPNEARAADLYIHAQDALLSVYTLKINLTNLGAEEIVDYAVVIVNVRQPNINLEVLEISTDNVTLTKTYTIINHGDTVTDLQVIPEEALKTSVQIEPNINHALLRTGESLSFKAVPVLTQDFTGYDGNISVAAAGETQNVSYAVALPPSKQVFLITLENRTWSIAFNDWYCTNRPRIDERFTLPSYIKKTVDGAPNVDNAYVITFFSLPWSRDTYRPHNVHLLMNGVEIGSLINTIPEKLCYMFPFDGYLLNYASEGLAENVLTLQMDNLNGGHYVVSANMEIILHVRKMEIAVIASNITEAEVLAEELGGTIADFADFAVYPEGITFSNSQPKAGDTITISVNIFNFGALLGNNVPIGLYVDSSLIETKTVSVIQSFSTQIVNFVWTATKGTHTLTVKVNEGQTISEKDYSNNQVSKSLSVLSVSPDIKKYVVTSMDEINQLCCSDGSYLERNGQIFIHFKVQSWNGEQYTLTNGIEVKILTSVDSFARTFKSDNQYGSDGIVKAGPYDTSNYYGTKFFYQVEDTTFCGIPVVGDGIKRFYQIKPRTSTSSVNVELSAEAAIGSPGEPIGLIGEGTLESCFEVENDGTSAKGVSFSRKARMALGGSLSTEMFLVSEPDVTRISAAGGIDLNLLAGILGGDKLELPEPSTSTKLVKYIVTLNILDYVRAKYTHLAPIIDQIRTLVIREINNLVKDYSIQLGAFRKASITSEAGVAMTIQKGALGSLTEKLEEALKVDQFVARLEGEGWVEPEFQLHLSAKQLKFRYSVRIGGTKELDFGFVMIKGSSSDWEVELAVELNYNLLTCCLASIVFETTIDSSVEVYNMLSFGGMLLRAEGTIQGKRIKSTTRYQLSPIQQPSILYDYICSVGLDTIYPESSGMRRTADLFILFSKIYDMMKHGLPVSYELTNELSDTTEFALTVSLPYVGKLEFRFTYLESQSYLAEQGHLLFVMKGISLETYCVKNVIYETTPKGFNVKDFIKENLISSLESLQELLHGTVVQMLEAQSKLYLNVYDMAGNHVGVNFAQNITDVNIPGSSYFDNQHGKIEIVLPHDLEDFKIVVDGTYAHYNHENYTLRIYRFGLENYTIFQLEEQEIEKGAS